MDTQPLSATKARILEAARTLFNEEGVGALSAVDIAAALGISPGHLYYHFKGKPEILTVLAGAYDDEVALVLEAAVGDCRHGAATLETLWIHVHILVEEAWDAPADIAWVGVGAVRWPGEPGVVRSGVSYFTFLGDPLPPL